MSKFTDGKPRIVTEKDLVAPWSGYRDGRTFRCHLCGYWYQLGDTWRWVYANFGKSPVRTGNFSVCEDCDGPDVLERMATAYEEGRRRFWWMIDPDGMPRRPKTKEDK